MYGPVVLLESDERVMNPNYFPYVPEPLFQLGHRKFDIIVEPTSQCVVFIKFCANPKMCHTTATQCKCQNPVTWICLDLVWIC